jgi:hypothetical protein
MMNIASISNKQSWEQKGELCSTQKNKKENFVALKRKQLSNGKINLNPERIN